MVNIKIIEILGLIFLTSYSLAKPTLKINQRDGDDGETAETVKCNINDSSTHGSCIPGYYLLSNDQLANEADQIGYLYYCNGEKCERKWEKGYFKNADINHNNDIPYIYCKMYYNRDDGWSDYYGNACKTIAVPAADKTTCSKSTDFINVTVGEAPNQYTEVKVCLSKNGPLVSFGNGLLFYKNDDGQRFIYISDGNSIKFGSDSNFLVDSENKVTAEPGKIGEYYRCYDDSCELNNKSEGYIYNDAYDISINKDGLVPYIQCIKNNNNKFDCGTIDTVTNNKCDASGENAAKEGEFFLTTENIGSEEEPINKTFYNLCLDTSTIPSASIKLDGKTEIEGDYFLSLNNQNSIFGYKNGIYSVLHVYDYKIYQKYVQSYYFYLYSIDNNKVIYKGNTCVGDPFTYIEFEQFPNTDEDYNNEVTYFRKTSS